MSHTEHRLVPFWLGWALSRQSVEQWLGQSQRDHQLDLARQRSQLTALQRQVCQVLYIATTEEPSDV